MASVDSKCVTVGIEKKPIDCRMEVLNDRLNECRCLLDSLVCILDKSVLCHYPKESPDLCKECADDIESNLYYRINNQIDMTEYMIRMIGDTISRIQI